MVDVCLSDNTRRPTPLFVSQLLNWISFCGQVNRAQGVLVVIGGIHASMCPEEAFGFVENMVVGEAENIWPQLLADFQAGRLQRAYRSEPTGWTQTVASRRDLFRWRYAFAPCRLCAVAKSKACSHRLYRDITLAGKFVRT